MVRGHHHRHDPGDPGLAGADRLSADRWREPAHREFATEGFGALINLAIGVFVLAVLSFQVSQAETRHEGASVGSV